MEGQCRHGRQRKLCDRHGRRRHEHVTSKRRKGHRKKHKSHRERHRRHHRHHRHHREHRHHRHGRKHRRSKKVRHAHRNKDCCHAIETKLARKRRHRDHRHRVNNRHHHARRALVSQTPSGVFSNAQGGTYTDGVLRRCTCEGCVSQQSRYVGVSPGWFHSGACMRPQWRKRRVHFGEVAKLRATRL